MADLYLDVAAVDIAAFVSGMSNEFPCDSDVRDPAHCPVTVITVGDAALLINVVCERWLGHRGGFRGASSRCRVACRAAARFGDQGRGAYWHCEDDPDSSCGHVLG